jgi:hypothetical protein
VTEDMAAAHDHFRPEGLRRTAQRRLVLRAVGCSRKAGPMTTTSPGVTAREDDAPVLLVAG